MRKLILSGLLLLLIGTFVVLAADKPITGGLVVIVSDESGPLSGAIVTISNTNGFVKPTSVQADGDGKAEFPVLKPGTGYRVEVSRPGYGTQVVDDIQVRAGESIKIPVVLAREMVESVRVVPRGKKNAKTKGEDRKEFNDQFVADLPARRANLPQNAADGNVPSFLELYGELGREVDAT